MRNLGLTSSVPPVGGRPAVRGQSGHAFRWGEGWFAEVRDGPGWRVERKCKAQIDEGVQMLLTIFEVNSKSSAQLALEDAPLHVMDAPAQEALEDQVVEAEV